MAKKSSKSGSRSDRVEELKRRYDAWAPVSRESSGFGPARAQLEAAMGIEISENLDANPERLDELAALRQIDDHQVLNTARWFELPTERRERLKKWARVERRNRWARRFRIIFSFLGLVSYYVGVVAAGLHLPMMEELVFVALCAPVVVAIVMLGKRFLQPKSAAPSEELRAPSVEAVMMQRFFDIGKGIAATGAWQSDPAGRLDLESEQHDIGSQLRQMELLAASIAELTGSDDPVLVRALSKERARLGSVRMSLVDRLAALDRYRVSLEQVDVDTERAARFSTVDEITSGLDMLEAGRASTEFSIDYTTRASEQLDESIRISRQMLEELRGHH
ncbi:MAG TPA: hypothetical protein PKC36_15345 [Dietzia sp.]|nr:hypothetical protein [Dietzia sp.]